MKILYAKTILYVYPNVESVIEQIDELVEKKAITSMNDYSPCLSQCEKITELTRQKREFIYLKNVLDRVLERLSEEEKVYLEYKYFKRKNKRDLGDYDFTSRNYFRKQIKLARKIANSLEKKGFDDAYFEKNLLCVEFMNEFCKRVEEQETLSRKNKTAAEKSRAAKEKNDGKRTSAERLKELTNNKNLSGATVKAIGRVCGENNGGENRKSG